MIKPSGRCPTGKSILQPLIAKPDQLIKRRGKLGLIKIKTDLENARDWIREKMASPFKIGETEGSD